MAKQGAKTKRPKLRFPEFRDRDGWESVPLGDASTPVSERVGKRKLTPVSVSAGIGFVPQTEKFGRDISGNQYARYTLVRDGDFVYNKGNSLKYPQGCVYQLRHWGEVAAPNVFISFRLKQGFVAEYFQYCFERNIHGVQLQRHITSGARSNGLLNVSKDQFFGVEIPTPKRDEQQKVADCLTSLDEVITAQGRKVEALQTHKRGLMQRLFPREGETRPRLRFPEFRNAAEWGATSVGAWSRSFSGGTPTSTRSDYYGGTIPFIRSAEIGSARTELSLTQIGLKASSAKLVDTGDVLLALYGANSGDVALARTSGAINQAILCIRPDGSKAFLYHYLTALQPWLVATFLQGGQGNLSGEIVKAIGIRVPSSEEQQRIADCLTSLDTRIRAETSRLAALKTHKQGLMQQLFPPPQAMGA